MRRWNGWGDDTVTYSLPNHTKIFLKEQIGPGLIPAEVSFPEVAAKVPKSRILRHPLISEDPVARALHARGQSLTDWIGLRSGRISSFPDGIAYPNDDAEVRELLRYARDAGAVVIPYGGGTSVVGHINPEPSGAPTITIDMRRMNQLEFFDETSHLAVFGSGITGPDLEAQLRARGHTLGHFPQSFEFSTLGGWVSTRSCGQQSLRYGRIENMFAGAKLETPVGPLVVPVFPASAAGPDLREIVLGSEGRLGILTKVSVRVRSLPEQEEFHGIFFPDFDRGRQAMREMVQDGLPLSMLRLGTAGETATTLAMSNNRKMIKILQNILSIMGFKSDRCLMVMGVTGDRAVVSTARNEAIGISRKNSGVHVGTNFGKVWHKSRFVTPYLRNSLWEMGYAVDTIETAANWSAVPALINAIESALHSSLGGFGERTHVFTHLSHVYESGSSIYTTFVFRLTPDPDETIRRWQTMKKAASQAIVTNGGTISHQHGIGQDHAAYLETEKGQLALTALRNLYRTCDPNRIMNPGKLFPNNIDNMV